MREGRGRKSGFLKTRLLVSPPHGKFPLASTGQFELNFHDNRFELQLIWFSTKFIRAVLR